MVVVPASVVQRYARYSRFNSPYPAHERGHALDLYPPPATTLARSPVAGTVLATRRVRAPSRPYAADMDHLLLIECDDSIARILHVDPRVSDGDTIDVGDRLGPFVRSGYFAPWVDNHLHLEFREPGDNLQRATGSLPIDVETDVTPLAWDGTGRVVDVDSTFIRLDSPTATTQGFTALASDRGIPLDGGLRHYTGGGIFTEMTGSISLLGTRIGHVTDGLVTWADVAIEANDRVSTGLSLFASRDSAGVKLIFDSGHQFTVGDAVTVAITPSETPIELG